MDDELLLAELDDDIAARPHKGVGLRWLRPLLVAAVIVGVIVGVYVAGGPNTDAAGPTAMDPAGPAAPASLAPASNAERRADLQTRVTQQPDDADARLELGVLLFNEGDLDGARTQWTAVTQLDPKNVHAWYNLGFYYLSTDPPDNAASQAAWKKVIDLDPNSDMARVVQSHLSGIGGPPEPPGMTTAAPISPVSAPTTTGGHPAPGATDVPVPAASPRTAGTGTPTPAQKAGR